jgi:hypothetical protein
MWTVAKQTHSLFDYWLTCVGAIATRVIICPIPSTRIPHLGRLSMTLCQHWVRRQTSKFNTQQYVAVRISVRGHIFLYTSWRYVKNVLGLIDAWQNIDRVLLANTRHLEALTTCCVRVAKTIESAGPFRFRPVAVRCVRRLKESRFTII